LLKVNETNQLFPKTVIGEQLSPTGTVMSPRSIPSAARTLPASTLLESTTLSQHWSEVGGVTGIVVGMAAARVCGVPMRDRRGTKEKQHTMSTEATTTESLENMFVRGA
jgi:hypothetical protein